jgi:salicylate hydroxylase
MEMAMRAVVVGGGVAGAASAVAMRLIGAEVTVYETYPDPAGPYGSFVSLASNGLRGLAALGCLQQVQQAGFPVERQRMWSGSGKLLGDVPRGRRSADPLISVTVMRGDLVSVLRQEAVRLGARVVLGERLVRGDDRRLAAADVVIGADGIWSTTRRAVDPTAPEPAYAGLSTVSGISDGLGFATGAFNMIFGRNGAFIYLPAPDGSVWWSAQVACPIAPDLTAIGLDELAMLLAAESLAVEILRAARDELNSTLNHVLAEVGRQCSDRVVLVGDAGHPVGAGQGASMAIEDAIVLGRQLSRSPSVSAALAAFDNERRGRLGKMAKSASTNRDAKTAGPLASRVRNLVMPITFNRFYERATGWLYDYDPGTLPDVRDLA